jgi:hypothetical protein
MTKPPARFQGYIEAICRAYSDKDEDLYQRLVDEEVVVTSPLFNVSGRQQLLEHFRVMTSTVQAGWSMTPMTFLSEDDWGLWQYRVTGNLVNGEPIDLLGCDRLHLRQGRAIRVYFHFDTAPLRAKLGLPADLVVGPSSGQGRG